jgi:hypothetical protein
MNMCMHVHACLCVCACDRACFLYVHMYARSHTLCVFSLRRATDCLSDINSLVRSS